MYAKIFMSIFDSTINEQPPHVFKVWVALIAFAQDGDGIVDMTVKALANRTELPIEQVQNAITILGSPDPMSRCQEQEGRRIVPIPDRPYGWQIVTFAHYRDIKRSGDRREYMREYMRERRGTSKQIVSKRKQSLGRLADTASASASSNTSALFEERWSRYPKKDGKREAARSFAKSVTDELQLARFDRALANYMGKIEAEKTAMKYVKNGSTFFANWEDFVEYEPPRESQATPRLVV